MTLRPTPLSVRVKVLAPEDVTYTFKEEGLVTATREGTLVSAGAGLVAKVLVSEGQRVVQGEMLLEIDASMLLLQVEEAGAAAQSHRQQISLQEAVIRQAEDERASAQAEWERQEELFQAGASPRADLEGAEQSLRQVEAALATSQETKAYQESMAQSAEAKVKQLQLDVSRCQIRAPYNAQDSNYAGKIAAISPYAVERISALGVSERRLEIQVQPEEGTPLGNGFSIDVSYIAAQETACLAVP